MVFEVGKVYRHSGGQLMKIVGTVDTTLYGNTLVGEVDDSADLKPIGRDEAAAENWTHAAPAEWSACFSDD